ncbi:MAG TPA: TIGR00269 family protein [Bacillota bacterium]
MKCVKCRGKAVIDLRRHNAAFCREHFVEYFQSQVERAIREFEMFGPDDHILVAVSGGKDSLVLWEVLLRLGYRADALYIDLGIGGYTAASTEKVRRFYDERVRPLGTDLHVVSLKADYGFGVDEAKDRVRRPACSACGLSKRYIFNKVAAEHGYDAVATGHNLDDEAAVLLGNVLRWNTSYLARQWPVLPAGRGFVRKVKPLVRLTERETAAYAVLTGVDYMVEECPNAVGATSHLYKDMLNRLEQQSPGSKHQFLFQFYRQGRSSMKGEDRPELNPCRHCGQPTPGDVCAFCRMTAMLMDRAGPTTPQRPARTSSARSG